MLRPVRISAILLVLSCALGAWAAWNDRYLGSPLLEIVDPRALHGASTLWSMAQDPRDGAIYVGEASALLRFDGARWISYPLHEDTYPRCLSFEPDSTRLWLGGLSELGFIETTGPHAFKLTSLRDKLPFPVDQLGDVLGCRASVGRVDFVAKTAVLCWDGSRMQVWRFPTSKRLIPVEFEGALWFHHIESGLYRLDAQGPTLVYGPEFFPDGIAHLQREGPLLAGGSSSGLNTLERSPRSLTPDELNQVTQKDRLGCVAALPNGYQAWQTIYSILFLSPDRTVVRKLDNATGLSRRVMSQFLDRDGYLWILNEGRLLRIAASGAVAAIPLVSGNEPTVSSITLNADHSALVCANGRIYRIQPGKSAAAPLQAEVLLVPDDHDTACATPFGLLLTHARRVAVFENGKEHELFSVNSRGIQSVRASQADPNRYLILRSDGLTVARRTAAGAWTWDDHLVDSTTTYALAETRNGDVWLRGTFTVPLILRLRNGRFEDPVPAFKPDAGLPQDGLILSRGDEIVYIAQRRLFILRDGRPPREVPIKLPERSWGVISDDGGRIYLSFPRPQAPDGYAIGIGRIDLSPDGSEARWHDLNIPSLATVGQVTCLAVSEEKGTDTLWIGGSSGLMQARTAEVSEWAAPLPPRIALLNSPSDSVRSAHFSWREKIQLNLNSTEIATRAALRFQVQLGGGEWSEPSERTLHEFSNITDGTYTFAARAINPAGQTSEPSYFTFVVLPPWYRSPWAYGGYAAILVASVLGAIRIRERRIRERNLELEKQVAERTAELVQANAAKDDFLASMSHEIRNPMNGVVGLSAAIDISHLDEEGRYRFGLLRHCATHLASLLEDILDFSKLQSGTIELDPQPFSPAELLDAVSAITSPVSAAAGVKVEFALGPSVPPRLIGDARRIRQVLLNYVSNAIKYAPQGDIDVTVWARIVGEKNAVLTFAVSDAGPGIPLEEQERIFEKFERGAGARSNRIPGTGMGLAVCRRLATKMGGNAWVESAPGEGSTFFLSLELPIAAPVTLDNATQTIVDLPKLALIVDDEDYNLVTLATMLERRGFQVLRAANADAALAALARHPDVVFLDYDMPDTTGPELAKRIRQTTQQRQPLIIATTAYSTVEKRRECLAAGMDGFLSKPIGEERLGSALAEAIQSRSPGDARHFVLPSRDSFDPLENLQTLARQHAQTLEAELAEFSTAARAEFEELHAGLTAEDRQNSARAAHKLAGRFGFLHAAAAMKRALQLERLCQQGNWAAARPLATELTQDWTSLHDTLTRLNCEPA